jgi:hypothetical protein
MVALVCFVIGGALMRLVIFGEPMFFFIGEAPMRFVIWEHHDAF